MQAGGVDDRIQGPEAEYVEEDRVSIRCCYHSWRYRCRYLLVFVGRRPDTEEPEERLDEEERRPHLEGADQ